MSALISGGEIVHVHIGSAGANIASAFWQLIAKEHHLVTSAHLRKGQKKIRRAGNKEKHKLSHLISAQQSSKRDSSLQLGLATQNLGVFFHETLQRHVPRAVFVDSDPSARYSGIFEPRSPLKHFFRPENFIFGRNGSGGIRTRAISEGLNVARLTLNSLRREMELADGLQGIQITHHLGGGTGAGLGCLLLELMRDELGGQVPLCPISLLPRPRDIGGRNNAVEVYNSVLSIPEMAEYSDLNLLIDNEALYDICFRLVALREPGWRDLNHIIGAVMAGLSSCMRFPSIHSKGPTISRLHLREMISALAVPNLPFVVPGFSPLTNRASNAPLGALLLTSSSESDSPVVHYRKAGTRMPSVSDLCQSLFRPSHLLTSIDPLGHHYLSALAVFRGLLGPDEVEQEINFSRLNGPERYKEWSQWMPPSLTARICPQPDVGLNLSATCVGSTTAIGSSISDLIEQYERLLAKRAFVHVYTGEGMEESELTDKLELCKDLVELYDAQYENSQSLRLEAYEAKRDLGMVPFNWKMKNTDAVVFDTHKTVKLKW